MSDLQKIQEELNAAVIGWMEAHRGLALGSRASINLYNAAKRFQEAQKPEQLYRVYTVNQGTHFSLTLDEVRRVVPHPHTGAHIHAIGVNGLAGPELTPEEVKALLESEE